MVVKGFESLLFALISTTSQNTTSERYAYVETTIKKFAFPILFGLRFVGWRGREWIAAKDDLLLCFQSFVPKHFRQVVLGYIRLYSSHLSLRRLIYNAICWKKKPWTKYYCVNRQQMLDYSFFLSLLYFFYYYYFL